MVRHGQTQWNASRRFQGRSDIALSDIGRRQARAIAQALRDEPFTHAFSSDLQRAHETAQTIAALHPELEVRTDERLREFDFGAWEGLTWAQIVERWPELLEREATAARLYAPNDGERFSDVVARVEAFLREVRSLGPDAHVLAVAHAGVLHAAVAALQPEGVDPEGLVFSTAGFTRFAMDGPRARIITLNDVSHLDSIA